MIEKQDLKIRTKQFALRITRLYTSLPKTTEAKDSGVIPCEKLNPLLKETDELTAIFVTIVKKVKSKRINH